MICYQHIMYGRLLHSDTFCIPVYSRTDQLSILFHDFIPTLFTLHSSLITDERYTSVSNVCVLLQSLRIFRLSSRESCDKDNYLRISLSTIYDRTMLLYCVHIYYIALDSCQLKLPIPVQIHKIDGYQSFVTVI